MSRKELTASNPTLRRDSSIQVEVSLPVRPRRREREPYGPPTAGVALRVPAPIPRISRLMALAIKFQDMVDQGEVNDYADLARLGYVTRARLTQIMNLLLQIAGLPTNLAQALTCHHLEVYWGVAIGTWALGK